MCWNFQSKTFSWGNLARCCGQSTHVNGLVAAGFHLVALDAAGCWWHRRWLSDMERSGVHASLISASCAPPRSTQAAFDERPSWKRFDLGWQPLVWRVSAWWPPFGGHVIPICSYSSSSHPQILTRARMYAHKPTRYTHPSRFIGKLRHSKKSTAT